MGSNENSDGLSALINNVPALVAAMGGTPELARKLAVVAVAMGQLEHALRNQPFTQE